MIPRSVILFTTTTNPYAGLVLSLHQLHCDWNPQGRDLLADRLAEILPPSTITELTRTRHRG